jgi:SAM-dependent methyltransferase
VVDISVMTKELFAAPREVSSLDDCLFYHTVDLPGHGTVEGFWDIRGGESQYLGGVALEGRRVLEVGPASGHLAFFMERQGAEVVSVEVADSRSWECFWEMDGPLPEDLEELLAINRTHLERFKNSYWFCHRAFGSKAAVHYGSAYSLPRELGEFDLSVLACVLLHTKHPLRILENCARATRETVVVVEPLKRELNAQTPAAFLPTPDQRWWDTWWGFSPKYFVDVLRSLGFPHTRVTFHTQTGYGEPTEMFTVVASRRAPAAARPPEEPPGAEISSPVERLRLRAGGLLQLPVRVVNRGQSPLSSHTEFPLLLSYHWRRASGEAAVWDGLRTALPRALYAGDEEDLLVAVRAPAEPGRYVLELAVVREGLKWYDDELTAPPPRIETVVTH